MRWAIAAALLPSFAMAQTAPLTMLNMSGEANLSRTVDGSVVGGPITRTLFVDGAVYGQPTGHWSLTARVANNGSNTTGQQVASYAQALNFATSGVANNRQIWGAVAEARDMTGQPSSVAGVMQGIEVDLFGNGPDDLTSQTGRTAIPIVIGQHSTAGLPFEATYGLNIVTPWWQTASVKRGLGVSTKFTEAGFDTRYGTQLPGAHAVWIGDGHDVAFGARGEWVFRYDPVSTRMRIYLAGKPVFSIDNTGVVRAAKFAVGVP